MGSDNTDTDTDALLASMDGMDMPEIENTKNTVLVKARVSSAIQTCDVRADDWLGKG